MLNVGCAYEIEKYKENKCALILINRIVFKIYFSKLKPDYVKYLICFDLNNGLMQNKNKILIFYCRNYFLRFNILVTSLSV